MCNKDSLSFKKYIFDTSYAHITLASMTEDGLSDSVRQVLLISLNPYDISLLLLQYNLLWAATLAIQEKWPFNTGGFP